MHLIHACWVYIALLEIVLRSRTSCDRGRVVKVDSLNAGGSGRSAVKIRFCPSAFSDLLGVDCRALSRCLTAIFTLIVSGWFHPHSAFTTPSNALAYISTSLHGRFFRQQQRCIELLLQPRPYPRHYLLLASSVNQDRLQTSRIPQHTHWLALRLVSNHAEREGQFLGEFSFEASANVTFAYSIHV